MQIDIDIQCLFYTHPCVSFVRSFILKIHFFPEKLKGENFYSTKKRRDENFFRLFFFQKLSVGT